jgi:hypothetical protein
MNEEKDIRSIDSLRNFCATAARLALFSQGRIDRIFHSPERETGFLSKSFELSFSTFLWALSKSYSILLANGDDACARRRCLRVCRIYPAYFDDVA